MSDFHQYGPVTALPRLVARPIEDLEARIRALSRRFPVALVIPMVPAEMDRKALATILEELRRVSYLDTLVLSLNRATASDYERALDYFAPYPGRRVVLWNESPSVLEFLQEMDAAGLYVGEPGKGRACWLAAGFVLAEERVEYVAFQDADVVNFRREMLARLVLPAIDPTVDFDFVKGYYARVSDRLHGRVTRLLLTPLLAAFTRLLGDHPYIRYLSSFRHALSGEFAVKCDLLELGARRPELVRALAQIAAETGLAVRGFADMTLGEVERLTCLPRAAAVRALVREYDEPFLAEDCAAATAALAAAARRRGLTVTRGGRFHHITGRSDKGRATRIVLNLLGAVDGPVRSVALGDAGNDASLLAVVDRPILVPRIDGSLAPELVQACPAAERAPAPGPRGWNAAVLAVLAGERLPPAETTAPTP